MVSASLPGSPSVLPYLSVFHPQPDHGTLLFPARNLLAASPAAAFLPRQLTPATLPEFQATAQLLLQEGSRAFFESGCKPGPLSITRNQWSIEESLGEDYLYLKRWDGQTLFLYQGENRIEAAVGRHAHDVAVYLATLCNLEDGSISTSYHFSFFSRALDRLRDTLRMPKAPLYEMAQEMAARIYTSDQYPAGSLRGRMGFADAPIHYSPFDTLDELSALTHSSSGKVWLLFGEDPNRKTPGTMIPEALAEGRDYLDLCLEDGRKKTSGALMPLTPQLIENLWNLAELLAASSLRVFRT